MIGDFLKEVGKAIKHGIYSGRDDTKQNIHVSDIFNFCSRRYVLSKQNGLYYNPPKSIGAGLALTFKLGRKIEDIITEGFEAIHSNNIVHSLFCSKCGELNKQFHTGSLLGVGTCKKCNGTLRKGGVYLSYKMSKSYVLEGNIDLCFGLDKAYPIEIKSIKEADFDNLTEPLISHQYQITGYMWLLKKLKAKNFVEDKGIVLYICKSHKQIPFRAFFVTPQPEAVKRLNNIKKELTKSEKEGKLPRRICSSPRDLMARECPRCGLCFEKED